MQDAPDPASAFLHLAIAAGALRFGHFQTKAGRLSPYFFNAGHFHGGHSLNEAGRYYAATILTHAPPFDMLFGPAYKGIPLAVATAMHLADRLGREIPFAFNRKEAKDHGEGGHLIGAPLQGRILLIDDVISAGTSVRESATWIEAAGARLAGVVIALDRQERGTGTENALREVERHFQIPVLAIARLDDLIRILAQDPARTESLAAIQAYRNAYGSG